MGPICLIGPNSQPEPIDQSPTEQSINRQSPIVNQAGVLQRINGIEVRLERKGPGFDVYHQDQLLGSVKRVERVGETMWQAEGSKRFRTMMTQAVEELLVRAELIDGLGW
jgi:hypothetical protein